MGLFKNPLKKLKKVIKVGDKLNPLKGKDKKKSAPAAAKPLAAGGGTARPATGLRASNTIGAARRRIPQ